MMLHTRYTPAGKTKKHRLSWQQMGTIVLGTTMVAAFCTFGLQFMLKSDVVQAQPALSPTAQPSPTPAPTPAPDQNALAETVPSPTVTPAPTPAFPVLTEDSEAGKWYYEDESMVIDIQRTQPLDGVVATVAVLTPKQEGGILQTAFAEGSYGKNVRARTRDIAASVNAIFAINGDYCGYRSDGIIVRGGTLYRSKPVREMLCLYGDGRLSVAKEASADAEALLAQGLQDTWSFGPILVQDGITAETFDTDVKGKNPRTALGQRADGSYVAVVVDGRLTGYSEGMTIQELAQYMTDLGCVNAYNLDGGMTSCMVFNGSVISTPCGTANKERALSDIIYIPKSVKAE